MGSNVLIVALRQCIRLEGYMACRGLSTYRTALCQAGPGPTDTHTGRGMPTKQNIKLQSQAPEHGDCDWIGPPDPDSNLRHKKYFVPEDETATEREFRLMKEETDHWNHEFWAEHNKSFTQRKERFIQTELARLGPVLDDGSTRRLTPEQLSVFYKAFLQEKHEKHKQYNMEWYKKNFKLLWPAFKVMWIRMFKKKKHHIV